MLNNPKVSIIIPVYNAEKYLRKCLNSLLHQTYTNLEIICINDGSTDSSPDILEEYAQKDTRMKILSQENQGQSVARNIGLEIASGDYISFIDADDWVYLTLYKTFVNALNKTDKDLDIWMFNISAYIKGENDVIPKLFFEAKDWNNHLSDDIIHTFDDCMRPFSRNLSAANKIYRKDFLKDINLKFPEGLKYEDQYFSLKAFFNAQSIMFTEDIFYRYRNYHETSISCIESKKVFDLFKVLELIDDEIERLGIYENYKYALFQYKYNVLTQHYNLCPKNLRDKYYNEMKTRILEASKKDLHPQIACQLSNYGIFQLVSENDRQGFEKILKL